MRKKAASALSVHCDLILLSGLKEDQHGHEKMDDHSCFFSEPEEIEQASDMS